MPLGLIDFMNRFYSYLFVPSKIENMKKLTNYGSPFIMLLVPLFLMIGLLLTNLDQEILLEKQNAGLKLRVPPIKQLVCTILK